MSDESDVRLRRIELCAKTAAYLTFAIAVIYVARAIADDVSRLWGPERGNSVHAVIVILGLMGAWLFHRRIRKV